MKIFLSMLKLFLSLFLLFFQSCDFFSFNKIEKTEVSFILPDCTFFQNESFTIDEWIIEVHSLDYSKTFSIPESQTNIFLYINKNSPLSITASPVVHFNSFPDSKINFFKPAGALYPYDEDFFSNGQIVLKWENGFTAFLMQQLYKSQQSEKTKTIFIQSFNWKKIETTINDKIFASAQADFLETGYFYNPWLCDYSKILQNISCGKFTVSLLSNKSCQNYSLSDEYKNTKINFYSSFIPENEIIQNYETVTIDSAATNFFLGEFYEITLSASSSKNVSTDIVPLPIVLKES